MLSFNDPLKKGEKPAASIGKGMVVVLVGETGSGKSALGMKLATQFHGEIICADSRTVYKGMDIGTAKPTRQDQIDVPHHLLDIALPSKQYTAADFKRQAENIIRDIHGRNKLPIIVGGTGLYIDAVIFNFKFPPKGDAVLREKLVNLSIEELQNELRERSITLPKNKSNRRHLIRAIETKGVVNNAGELRPNTLVIGLSIPANELSKRISERVEKMVKAGFEQEVRRLIQKYGDTIEALQAPGYKAFRRYIGGSLSLKEAKELFIRNDLQLAKHQRTWFKRNSSIQWCTDPKQVVDIVTTFLNNSQ